LLQLLPGRLRFSLQGGCSLLVLGDLFGMFGLGGCDALFGFLVDPGGQATNQILDCLADCHATACSRPLLFLDLFEVAVDRALGASVAELFSHRINRRVAPVGQ